MSQQSQETVVRYRGESIPYDCPYPSMGRNGAPYGYNVDPGAGSAMDRLQRHWPERPQVRDLRERDGEITALFPAAPVSPDSDLLKEAVGLLRDSRQNFITDELHEEIDAFLSKVAARAAHTGEG